MLPVAPNRAAVLSVCIMATVVGMMLLVRLLLRLSRIKGVSLIR